MSMNYHFFDLGGTLFDSVFTKRMALRQLVMSKGLPLSARLESLDYVEMRGRELIAALNRMYGISSDEMGDQRDYDEFTLIEDNMQKRLVEGSVAYLSLLKRRGDPCYIVTNSGLERVTRNIERTALSIFFDRRNIVGRDDKDIEPKKPSPYLYLKALQISGASPREVVAYEDTRRGVEGARNADIENIIGLNPTGRRENEMLDAGAGIICRNYKELLQISQMVA